MNIDVDIDNVLSNFDETLLYIVSGRDNREYSDPHNMTIKWLKKYNIEYDKLILTNA